MEAFRLQDTTHTLVLSSLTRSSKMSVRRSGSNLTDRFKWRVERLAPRMNTSFDNTSHKGHQMWVLDAIWVATSQSESTQSSACSISYTESPMCTPWKPLQICTTRQVFLQVTRKNLSIWKGLTLDITSKISRKRSRTKFCTNSNSTLCVSIHFTKVPKNKGPAARTIITEAEALAAIRLTNKGKIESMNRIRKVYSYASLITKRASTDRSNLECLTQRIFLTWKLSRSLVFP